MDGRSWRSDDRPSDCSIFQDEMHNTHKRHMFLFSISRPTCRLEKVRTGSGKTAPGLVASGLSGSDWSLWPWLKPWTIYHEEMYFFHWMLVSHACHLLDINLWCRATALYQKQEYFISKTHCKQMVIMLWCCLFLFQRCLESFQALRYDNTSADKWHHDSFCQHCWNA